MCRHRSHKLPAPNLKGNSFGATKGFSIIETVIGAFLLVTTLIGAASLMVSSNTSYSSASTKDRHEALIDDDLAVIRQIARRYTWCPGVATFTGEDCNGAGPGSEDYYFIDLDETTTPPEDCSTNAGCAAFADACDNGNNLLQPLIDQIPSNPAFATESITRTVVIDDPVAHRLRLTYDSPGNVSRVVTLVPPLSNWCPL